MKPEVHSMFRRSVEVTQEQDIDGAIYDVEAALARLANLAANAPGAVHARIAAGERLIKAHAKLGDVIVFSGAREEPL